MILDIAPSFMHTEVVVTIDLMHVCRVQILVMHIIRRRDGPMASK